MAKYFIEDTTLSSIGTAIREKTGSSDLISPTDMPTAIRGIESGSGSGLTSWTINNSSTSSTYTHPTSNNGMNEYLDGKDFTITLNANPGYMFTGCDSLVDLSKVVINMNASSVWNGAAAMFSSCNNLEQLPTLNINNDCSKDAVLFQNIFRYCSRLRNIDNTFWKSLMSLKDGYNSQTFRFDAIFHDCNGLRQLPDMTVFDSVITSQTNANRHLYYLMCYDCYVLDTIEYLPVIETTNTITSNMFESTFNYCYRLKDIIFATDNGTPYTRTWSNQTIDLTNHVGYGETSNNFINHNSGITEDKQVSNDATYQALKDDPDWFTYDIAYSRYNHDSAVNTINSLPDCSAGSGNTIKFTGASGSATDGGAINTLTEEEIAVATAKGWTVSYA